MPFSYYFSLKVWIIETHHPPDGVGNKVRLRGGWPHREVKKKITKVVSNSS